MNHQRPIHLNPLAIRLPLAAWISISHRITGILVFLLIPFLLWSLQGALASPEALTQVKEVWATPWGRVLGFLLFAAMCFHLIAGFRHLIMDLHFADSAKGGRAGAWMVIVLFVATLAMAIRFWG